MFTVKNQISELRERVDGLEADRGAAPLCGVFHAKALGLGAPGIRSKPSLEMCIDDYSLGKYNGFKLGKGFWDTKDSAEDAHVDGRGLISNKLNKKQLLDPEMVLFHDATKLWALPVTNTTVGGVLRPFTSQSAVTRLQHIRTASGQSLVAPAHQGAQDLRAQSQQPLSRWVPKHAGVDDNGRADDTALAQQVANTPIVTSFGDLSLTHRAHSCLTMTQ
jgi:hypothetical protein